MLTVSFPLSCRSNSSVCFLLPAENSAQSGGRGGRGGEEAAGPSAPAHPAFQPQRSDGAQVSARSASPHLANWHRPLALHHLRRIRCFGSIAAAAAAAAREMIAIMFEGTG